MSVLVSAAFTAMLCRWNETEYFVPYTTARKAHFTRWVQRHPVCFCCDCRSRADNFTQPVNEVWIDRDAFHCWQSYLDRHPADRD